MLSSRSIHMRSLLTSTCGREALYSPSNWSNSWVWRVPSGGTSSAERVIWSVKGMESVAENRWLGPSSPTLPSRSLAVSPFSARNSTAIPST